MSEPASILPIIQRIREDYGPLLSNAEVGEATYRVAVAAGPEWGVLLKPHGAGAPSPAGRISLDILVHVPTTQEYDIWQAADGPDEGPGPAVPTFQKLPFKVGQHPSGASMDRVVVVANRPEPIPQPVPDRPQPVPIPAPTPPIPAPEPPIPAPCQAVESAAEVLDALHELRLDHLRVIDHLDALHQKLEIQGGLLEEARAALARIENNQRKPRRVQVGGWRTGTLSGQVDGIEG